MRSDLTLRWKVFTRMSEARGTMGPLPCVYVQADEGGWPVRVGKAPHGLAAQFRGVLAEAFDAAMHGSGNLLFVAHVKGPSIAAIERELRWRLRNVCKNGGARPARPPRLRPKLRHRGSPPKLPVRGDLVE